MSTVTDRELHARVTAELYEVCSGADDLARAYATLDLDELDRAELHVRRHLARLRQLRPHLDTRRRRAPRPAPPDRVTAVYS